VMQLLQCYLRAAELEMWAAERARTKLRGREADEGQRARECHTVGRWAEAEDTDLENEAQRAKQKLRSVDRTRP
jgi:hypothetical protein